MKRKALFYASLLILFSACQKDRQLTQGEKPEKIITLSSAEYQSIAFDHPKPLSDQQTVGLVIKFLEKNQGFEKRSDSKIAVEEKIVLDLDSVPGTKSSHRVSQVPVYKLAISNRSIRGDGKEVAYVSADERFPAVLAYYLAPKDAEEPHEGADLMLSAAYDILKNNIREVEARKVHLRKSTLKKLAAGLSVKEEEVQFEKIKDYIHIQEKPSTKAPMLSAGSLGTVISSYGPYLSTAWSKGMPYNRLMAQSCPSNWLWDNRYPISSAVVAAAQVLAAYQPAMSVSGTTMDWGYLTQNAEIYEESDYFGSYVQDPLLRRNMVATLMKGIGESTSVSYTCTSSSVNFTNIRNYLNARGINVAASSPLNVPNVKTSIENIKPVFMYGQTSSNGGHWWVIDGVAITAGTQSYLPGYNLYLHANMGEGSYYLGYYLVGTNQSVTFDTGFAHFSQNFQTYHINTTL